MKKTFLRMCRVAPAALALVVGDPARGQITTVVAPNNLLNTDGNSLAGLPFDTSSTGRRYQQVFDSSQFSSLANAGGGFITFMAFRLDSGCHQPEGQTIPSLQVDLSTTSKGP